MKNLIYAVALFIVVSCTKQNEWLEAKNNRSDVVPTSISDFQSLLNLDDMFGAPSLSILGTDNLFVPSVTVLAASFPIERKTYIFDDLLFTENVNTEWHRPFYIIENANVALEGIEKIKPTASEQPNWNYVKGSALFYRGLAYSYLLNTFCKPYQKDSSAQFLGMPIRLKSDINENPKRSSLQATYQQVIDDLTASESLLPNLTSYQTRPCKASVQALLSRVYLGMGNFDKALEYSEKSLSLFNTLIDFNTLSTTSSQSFPAYPNNVEISFYSVEAGSYALSLPFSSFVDSVLYASYNANDLRKAIFFKSSGNYFTFKGQYNGGITYFCGIAANEVILTKAECNARLGNVNQAMNDLNSLLIKRWKNGTFIPFTAASVSDALSKIITERRKELPFTGQLRWFDLRRLNLDPQLAKSVTHVVNGQNYILQPNSSRYVFDIPALEIQLSGLQQNIR